MQDEARDEEHGDESSAARPAAAPVWCVVANVAETRPFGPGGQETRRGTRLFKGGAKLYCFPVVWGDGGKSIKVVGRHRKSHRYITAAVRSRDLANWRPVLVYSPHVARLLSEHWDGTEIAREYATALAAWWQGSPMPADIEAAWTRHQWKRLGRSPPLASVGEVWRRLVRWLRHLWS